MIYLLPVLLNVPASPAVSVQAPIPRSGLVHGAHSRRPMNTSWPLSMSLTLTKRSREETTRS